MAEIGFSQSDLAPFAGPGHWNDPDMLEIGNGGMTAEEYKTHFSLWAMIAAPLIAGNDTRSMTPEIAAILMNKEVIAVDQDGLGAGGKRVNRAGDIEIWQKQLSSGDIAVAVFNHSNQEMRAVIPWSVLGIGPGYTVRDLWAHADLGTSSKVPSASIAAHGVLMFRLKKSS
jgi:alpha-galactosidase